jgi:2-succinyl-6-hydroxy-2,4-cyclohexadiene-1-carboxylate synthase
VNGLRSIGVNGISLQIREIGKTGEAIVFLHYGGGNMVMWNGVIPFFTDDFRVILMDLRGHGKSDRPAGGYHMDAMARDVVGVLDALGVEKAHVVGSSLGAEVGLSMAANFPGRVYSLVCEGALFNEFGPYGLWDGTVEEFKKHAEKTLAGIRDREEKSFSSLDALAADSQAFFEARGWWSDIIEAVVRYDAIRTEDGKFVKSWDRIAEAYTQHYLFYDFSAYYERVECPLLMMPDVYPGQDEWEKEIMAGFFKLVKRGRITAVPEWIHPFGWMVTPESGARAVLEFLNDVKSGAI